jgi:Protein of unknown function (DUF3311)
MGAPGTPRHTGRWALISLILIAPFVGLLYPQWYSKVDPQLQGIPFFIWYQFAWLIFGTFLLVVVYLVRGEGGDP